MPFFEPGRLLTSIRGKPTIDGRSLSSKHEVASYRMQTIRCDDEIGSVLLSVRKSHTDVLVVILRHFRTKDDLHLQTECQLV